MIAMAPARSAPDRSAHTREAILSADEAKPKPPAPKCPWCGVRQDAASSVVELAIHGWLCRTLHARKRHLPAYVKPQAEVIPLCPICGTRPATLPDLVDGRRLMVCVQCRDGVVKETAVPKTRERMLAALGRSNGLDIHELAQVLDEDSELGRAKLSAALNRAIKAGLVVFTGMKMDRTYHLARR